MTNPDEEVVGDSAQWTLCRGCGGRCEEGRIRYHKDGDYCPYCSETAETEPVSTDCGQSVSQDHRDWYCPECDRVLDDLVWDFREDKDASIVCGNCGNTDTERVATDGGQPCPAYSEDCGFVNDGRCTVCDFVRPMTDGGEPVGESGSGIDRVPPLNMTVEERKTLLHCIIAGEDEAVDHFGEEEAERIDSLKINSASQLIGTEVTAVPSDSAQSNAVPHSMELEETEVGHCRQDSTDEYIGRAGDGDKDLLNTPIGERGWLGNPFRLDNGWSRGESVSNFRRVFVWRLHADPDFRKAVRDLQGKRLGCWCQRLDDDGPECHGEVIAEYADRLASGKFNGGAGN